MPNGSDVDVWCAGHRCIRTGRVSHERVLKQRRERIPVDKGEHCKASSVTPTEEEYFGSQGVFKGAG